MSLRAAPTQSSSGASLEDVLLERVKDPGAAATAMTASVSLESSDGDSWTVEQASADGYCCDHTFLGISSDGAARIAFERDDNTLALALGSPGGWSQEPLVDSTGSMLGTVGSVAVDSADVVHYVYTNSTGHLVYVSSGAGTIVRDGVLEFMMVLDASGRALVIHTTADGLYYARY